MKSLYIAAATAVIAAAMFVPSTDAAEAAMSIPLAGEARLIKVGDMLPKPPPDEPGTTRPELRGQALRNQAVANLKKRFDAAADPSTHLLTQAQAKSAGFGYVADHFQAIDRNGSGYVSFEDLLQYLKSRKGAAFNKDS
ncbi:MAG: EF-hand domain-containing protein [Collimonas sp.]|uniref:EF-hand domain-containing protein n=1 Tax=Collimonas sp. TaxID=1963772 RepID=UPI0032650BF0